MDTSTAFLNEEIDTELYMRVPEGVEVEGEPLDSEALGSSAAKGTIWDKTRGLSMVLNSTRF